MIEQSVSLASNGVVKVPGYEQLVRFGYTKNRGVYRLAVTATGEWKGLAIRCFWHVPDGKDPASSLVVDGYVGVPASVTAQPGNGCITFEGSDGTKTVTSADLHYRVIANSGTEDGTEPEPGTPAWQQLVDAVHTDATAAEQAKTDAQTSASEAATSADNANQSAQEAADSLQELKDGIASGNFKGEKGDKGDPGKDAVVDTTLSNSGEAADAKAVGNEISSLKEDKLDKPANPAVGQILRVKSIDETGKIVLETVAGGGGSGLPDGGAAGQVLVKKTDANRDTEWKTVVLELTPNTTYDIDALIAAYDAGAVITVRDQSFSYTITGCNHVSKTLSGFGSIDSAGFFFTCNVTYNGLVRTGRGRAIPVPAGGSTGQILSKKSATSGDTMWVDPQTATVRTAMDDVAVAGAKYFLGEQTALSITMPTDAQTGQEIMVVFSNGQTACTMAVDLDDFDFVPKANSMCKIVFLCVAADTWLVDAKEG